MYGGAPQRKGKKDKELVEDCCKKRERTKFLLVKVGSQGFAQHTVRLWNSGYFKSSWKKSHQ